MKKAVIFDMDGVLIDSETFYFKRRMDFFRQNGIKPGSDQLADYVGNSEEQTWQLLVPDQSKREHIYQEYLTYRDHHSIDFTKAMRRSVPLLLSSLKDEGILLGLASSSPRKEIDRMLSDCQLADYFSYVISGEELKESKPNPEIYLISREALGCEDCLAVEDSTLGIASAKAAGIYTVALQQDFPMEQREADIVITELTELLDLPRIKEDSAINVR